MYKIDIFNRLWDKTKGFKTNIKASKIGLDYDFVRPYCEEYKQGEVKEININAVATAIQEPTRQKEFWDVVEQCKKYKRTGEFNGYNFEKLFKLTKMPKDIQERFATKVSEAEYRELNAYKLLTNLEYHGNIIMSLKEKIKYQREYLSYISYTNPDLDKRYIVVTNLNTNYSPRFVAYCLKNGKTCQMKVRKDKKGRTLGVVTSFKDTPFEEGDILFMNTVKQEPKMKKVGDDWVKDYSNKEWWIYDYKKIVDIQQERM